MRRAGCQAVSPRSGDNLLDKRDSIMADALLVPASSVQKNCRIKVYPNGEVGEILACSLAKFTPPGWERVDKVQRVRGDGITAEGTERARRRARQHVSDLIKCNSDMDVFFTLTIAPDAVTESGQAVGRTDYDAINKKLQQWLSDRVRRRKMKYVAVYEYHEKNVCEDGKHAIHVHGVCNHDALNMADSGHKYRDKAGHWHHIYNVSDWTLGITTAMYTYGDRWAAAAYISKYIYKSERPVGGRWYMHSHNLQEPRYEYINIDFNATQGHSIYVESAHCTYKYIPPYAIAELHEDA